MKKYQLSDRTALFPDSRWPVTGQGIYNGRPAYKNEYFKLFSGRLKSKYPLLSPNDLFWNITDLEPNVAVFILNLISLKV